jgi:dipeptidyl aminopeptidase
VGAFAGTVYSVPTHLVKSGKQHITMDHIFNGTFGVTTKTLNWVKEGELSRLHVLILSS